MPGSSPTSIEELVMSSARAYLFGHARAWDVPGDGRRPARPSGAARSRGRARFRVAGRRLADSPAAARAGACA